MRRSIPLLAGAALALAAATASLTVAGCNDSAGYSEPGPRPRVVNASISGGNTVNCVPKETGGACTIELSVEFFLPEDQFVRSAIVRFQRDGSDVGVDRFYPVRDLTYGGGDAKAVAVGFTTPIPPNLIGSGALFTFSVRLVTGLGELSDPATLTVTVTNIPKTTGTPVGDAGASP